MLQKCHLAQFSVYVRVTVAVLKPLSHEGISDVVLIAGNIESEDDDFGNKCQ